MSIFHITYLSDTYHVKGYLGIPDGYRLSVSVLQDLLWSRYPDAVDLPIREVEGENNLCHAESGQELLNATLPALIYCRGGIGKVGMVKLDWIRLFANQGYIIFAPSYRGNEGGEGRDEFGGADLEDVSEAFRILQSFPFVRKDQISLLGFSRGSINATQVACLHPDTYKLILWGGVTDLAKTYAQRVDLRRMLKRVIGGTPAKYPERYAMRSPIFYKDQIHCPVLIVQGTDDVQVDQSHALEMYHALQARQANVELHLYRGYGHHLPPLVHEAVVERMFDWLKADV
jgi:dipeptidyl aminopeptidase/acylaminoacyl peptidase